mgnify:CR=1 FL=1
MKNLIIVSCMLLIANFGFSQSTPRLQGPAAKNAKPWQNKSKKSEVVIVKDKKFLKGPAAKNAKPWEKNDTSQAYAAVKRDNRHKLKGPQAKNFKPWMLSTLTEIDTIAIKERDSSKIKRATE